MTIECLGVDVAITEPMVIDTVLATGMEAIVIGAHVFLTYFADRPEYMGHELHVTRTVCARIAFPLAEIGAARSRLTSALRYGAQHTSWPDGPSAGRG